MTKAIAGVVRCQLSPEVCELCIRRRSRVLIYDIPIPSRKVMDVNYTVCACLQAALDEGIVVGKVLRVERSDYVVREVLP